MERRIASRYARALFQAARKLNVVASVGDDLEAIGTILLHDERLRGFVASPNVPRQEKLRLLERVFGDRVTALTMQALRLMLAKRRENLIGHMSEEYANLRRDHENILHCLVVSAAPLSAAERQAIVRRIAQATGKTIEAEFDLDPALIGGVQVRYGDYVLDGTLRGGLDRLRERLHYDFLKKT
jgi:F-type H+-transporting ATPase subunit delta